ncbi:hypothetical protein HN51_071349 [Arachis hypogaea]|uniref:TMV resistance protein N n=1 Tax=Arachis hypogaea TaxID=3818 RepID=UPI000DEC5852|nr:disease resistance protein RML1B [Arachis hypogaea]
MGDPRLSLVLSSHSSSSDYGWDYDVFLSFRGPDTGKHFAGNLYYALKQRGIRTFYADRELERGEELAPTLLKRIQDSKTAIPVFSPGYADSAFCLLELAAIMDNSKAKGRLVFPVFYGVSASDVRGQTGDYEKAMAKHQSRNDHHVVQKWREALQQAANLSGSSFKFQNEYEFEFIEKIIEVVSKNVNRTLLCVAKHPVGLESPVQEVCKLLDVGPGCNNNQVCMVGIHGIGGIGKSTLAKAVFNYIADQFDSSCFLENVRENSSKHGLEHLQAKLLFDIVGEKNISLIGPSEGVPLIKHRLHQKKVLLILDDVDEEKQLKELAGGLDWFGSGSRVIVTTQDQQVLRLHGIETKYELNGLKFEDARKLFELKLKKKADPHFDDVINRAVTYCAKHPLALELISSDLGSINADEWESALGHYERNLGKEIYDKLKRSFDRLEKEVQSVFLDIACCFKGLSRTEVNNMLRAHHGFCPIYAIRLLEEKSLIMIEDNEVRLHDKIHEMGRKIEQEGKHGHRYLLSSYEAIVQFFKHKGIHDKIEMIVLDLSSSKEQVVEWDGEGFKDMKSLKTLINRNVYFSQDPNHLPNSLRVFEWPGYSSRSLPANFCPKELVLFKLPSNRLMSLNFLKEFVNMRVLNFDDAECVKAIPSLSSTPNLEELSFSNCESLTEIDESVGNLRKLKILNAFGCSKLRSFPPLKLPSIEELNFTSCSNLENFPKILEKMENLTKLELDCTAIKAIPDLFSAENLVELSFSYCVNLIEIDESVGFLIKLRLLNAFGCCKLRSFPSLLLPSLEELDLSWCSSLENFPEILDKMEKITRLRLQYTPIKELPNSIQNLTRLRDLEMFECGMLQLPSNITLLPELRHILFCRTPNQDEGEEKLSWIESSNSTLHASQCTISDEIFPNLFGWFSMYMEELDLFRVNFTFLPDCIMECPLLKELNLDQCHNLQRIRWLPPNLETLSVTCCRSLEDLDLTILPGSTKEYYNFRRLIVDNCENLQIIKGIPPEGLSATNCLSLPSSYISMLLNEELGEVGRNIWRFVPGSGNCIPEWFHPCKNGNSSVSFWFRNKFPAISLCVFLGALGKHQIAFYFCPKLEINGNTVNKWLLENKKYWFVQEAEADHIFILHEKQMNNENSVNEALVRNKEWNHAKIFVDVYSPRGWTEIDMQIGIHVFKGKNSMKDVQFTNPYNNVTGESNSVDSTQQSGTSIVKVNLARISNNYSRTF